MSSATLPRFRTAVLPFLLVLAVVATFAPTAGATSFVDVPDAALADAAPAVAVVRVLDDGRPGPEGGLPSTLHLVEVERVLKGHLAGGRVELRIPGGVTAGGFGWEVLGAPDLRRGERAIVFLAPRADGAYALVELMLGVFVERPRDGRRLALRDLSGAHEVGRDGGAHRETAPSSVPTERGFDAFAEWIADRAAGVHRAADYRVEVRAAAGDGTARAAEPFVLFDDGGQCSGASLPIRWFEFDGGGSVLWRMNAFGQPGMPGSPGGVAQFQAALAAWNQDAGSDVSLVYGGTTGATEVSGAGTGLITFEDPHDDIAGSFGGSGVLAIGGPYFLCSARSRGGVGYRPALHGFIVTQNGAGSFFGGHGGEDGEEVFAHELGHTLGFGHSPVGDALMRAYAYGNGRGARLGADDRAALASVYGAGGGGGGGGGGTPPAAPSSLTGAASSATDVRLSWRDNSADETAFHVEMDPGSGFRSVGSVGDDVTRVTLTGLQPGTTHRFRVRARNAAGFSAYSGVLSLRTPAAVAGACAEPNVLCLQGGRFAVDVTWKSHHQAGSSGVGRAVRGTDASGYFWFFNADNVELVVKVLDGRPVNGNFWFFYGALSDVEYVIRVRDTVAGTTRTYRNPPGRLCGRGDTGAFTAASLGEPQASVYLAAAAPPPAAAAAAPSQSPGTATGGGTCAPAPGVLCLGNGRFEVTVDWANQHAGGNRGVGTVSPAAVGGDKTGFFWFFHRDNVELVVKLIDGRAVNGRFWVFFGGLSDVGYTLRVRDTVLDQVRTYRNAPGSICGRGDTSAF